VRLLRYTLTLVVITCLAYLAFSSFNVFIPNDIIFSLGFSSTNWIGIITYPFLHIGIAHLVGNMALLLALGLIVESKLNCKDYYATYFISSAFAGTLFVLLTKNIFLAGASAAIGGLIIPACLIDFKKTISYIVLFSVAGMLLLYPIDYAIASYYDYSAQAGAQLGEAFNKTLEQKAQAYDNISELDDKFNRGEIDISVYNQTKQSLAEQIQNLTVDEQTISEQLNRTTAVVSNIDEGKEREGASKPSLLAHIIGSFAGLGYLAIFRRDIVWNSGYQVSRLERWLKKRLKRSRKAG
jgi:membrane associated rhomboid family serine protease